MTGKFTWVVTDHARLGPKRRLRFFRWLIGMPPRQSFVPRAIYDSTFEQWRDRYDEAVKKGRK